MNEREIKRRFPNCSPAFIQANLDADDSGVCAVHSKLDERAALVEPAQREEALWHDADAKFEIVFTVHSTHPCDWDGYDIKALQDFLITAGVIPDDGWKTLSGRVVAKKVGTKEEEKTVIEIKVV